jgi:ElaB/YqjD/DUF883 family membrane-anchored ribosome-binding protein
MPNTKRRKNIMAETHSIINDLQEEATEDLRAGTEKVKRQVEKAGSQLKTDAENAWEDLIDLVRRHPGKALGFTLAAGVAAGSLIARSRHGSASEKIRDLAGTGVDAWDRVKTGFDDAIGTLKDAMEEAVEKFK